MHESDQRKSRLHKVRVLVVAASAETQFHQKRGPKIPQYLKLH